MDLIEKLNKISAAWKKQFEEPFTEHWNPSRFGSAPDLPMKWSIDQNGILFLDNVWICPVRYIDEAELEMTAACVSPVSFTLDLTDGSVVTIIITKYAGKYAIRGIERYV